MLPQSSFVHNSLERRLSLQGIIRARDFLWRQREGESFFLYRNTLVTSFFTTSSMLFDFSESSRWDRACYAPRLWDKEKWKDVPAHLRS